MLDINNVPVVLTTVETTQENQSFRNLSNVNRFVILGTRKISLFCTAASGDGVTQDLFFKNIDGQLAINVNIPLEFSAETGALTEIRSNNIGIAAISRHGIMKIKFANRVRFVG